MGHLQIELKITMPDPLPSPCLSAINEQDQVTFSYLTNFAKFPEVSGAEYPSRTTCRCGEQTRKSVFKNNIILAS